MTDEQIIKALELCAHWENDKTCEDCPANVFGFGCANKMSKFVLGLINRQTAEIENLKADNDMYQKVNCLIAGQRDDRDKEIEELQTQMEWLTGYNKNLLDANTALSEEIEICKSEAIKEFAQRLKKYLCLDLREGISVVTIDNIDNLVKEMTEGI